MKNRIITIITVAGLAIAGPLSAHTLGGTTPTMDHAHPVFLSAVKTYQLIAPTKIPGISDQITVTWTAKPACPNNKLVQEYHIQKLETCYTCHR